MDRSETIIELLKRGAAPAPAISAPGRPDLSYAALRDQVTATIESLNLLGVGRDDVVAIVLPNGPEMAVAFLAIAANFYELLCTAGFPMIFTRLLTLQEANGARHYLYLALYNVIYVLPLLVIVLTFVRSMGRRQLSEREGRLLKLLSGLMMLGLGIVLLLAPDRLGEIGVAVVLPLLAIALTGLAARLTRN